MYTGIAVFQFLFYTVRSAKIPVYGDFSRQLSPEQKKGLNMDPASIIQLIILIILLFLSAFFSSAETALTTVNKIKVKSLADEGSKRADLVLKITDQQGKMLSAILIGNNIVNLSASSLATTLAVSVWGSIGAGIATGLLTLLVLIFGEITPKTMATINSLNVSLRYAPIIWRLMYILTPVIFIVDHLAGAFMRLLGTDPNKKNDDITEEELRTFVDVSHEAGVIEHDERNFIHKLFDFGDATVREVMIPRIDITMVNVNWSYKKLIEVFSECMFTRLPVYEEDSDHIIGIINMKDLLLVEDHEHFSIREHLREPYFTYELKNTSDLFDEMRQNSIAMAIAMDEYGAVAGIVTLEDLLEEIVGEIRDEFDQDEEDDIIQINDREYVVLGSMNLEDLMDIIPLGFESEDYDTIGGYLTGAFDHFPKTGETYASSTGAILRVDAAEKHRITRIRIRLPEEIASQVDEEDLPYLAGEESVE